MLSFCVEGTLLEAALMEQEQCEGDGREKEYLTRIRCLSSAKLLGEFGENDDSTDVDAPLPMFTDTTVEGGVADEWVVWDYEHVRLCDGEGRGGIPFTLVDCELDASTAQTEEEDEQEEGGTTTITPAPTPSPAPAPAAVPTRTPPAIPSPVTAPSPTEMRRLGCAIENELYKAYSATLVPGVRPPITEPPRDAVPDFSPADRATIYNLAGWSLNTVAKKLGQNPETADWCSALVSYCSIPRKDAKAADLPIEKVRHMA